MARTSTAPEQNKSTEPTVEDTAVATEETTEPQASPTPETTEAGTQAVENRTEETVLKVSKVVNIRPDEVYCHERFFRGKEQASSRELAQTILEEHTALLGLEENAENMSTALDTFGGDVALSALPQAKTLLVKIFGKDKPTPAVPTEEKPSSFLHKTVANVGSSALQYLYYNDKITKSNLEQKRKKRLNRRIFLYKGIDAVVGLIPKAGFILDYIWQSNKLTGRLFKKERVKSEKELKHFGLDLAQVQEAIRTNTLDQIENTLEANIAQEVIDRRAGKSRIRKPGLLSRLNPFSKKKEHTHPPANDPVTA